MKEITVQELKQLIDEGSDVKIIDVREPHEYESGNIGGLLIPLGDLLNSVDRIPRDKQVVIHCRSGARSAAAIMELERNHGYSNLSNLKGGIKAWAEAFDQDLAV